MCYYRTTNLLPLVVAGVTLAILPIAPSLSAAQTNIVYSFTATTITNDQLGNFVGTALSDQIYFTNRAFTVRIYADTNAVYSVPEPGFVIDAVDALAATIEVVGIGTVSQRRLPDHVVPKPHCPNDRNRPARRRQFRPDDIQRASGAGGSERPVPPLVLSAYDGYMVYWNSAGPAVVRGIFSRIVQGFLR